MAMWKISINVSVLILWIVLVRFLGRKHLSRNVIVAMWNLVMIRALIPLQIPVEKIPFVEEKLKQISMSNNAFGALSFQNSGRLIEVPADIAKAGEIREYIFMVWLIGMIMACLLMIWRGLSEFRFLREIVPTECRQVEEIINKSGIRRTVRVYTGRHFCSPVTCGMFQPRIILPEDFDKEGEANIRNIILHELSHIRRFDVLKRVCMCMAVCVHWFNPLMWICLHLYRYDQEMACDERVLREMDYKDAKEYAETLIRMSAQNEREAILFEGFQRKNAQRRRILAAIENKKMGVVGTVAALLVMASSLVSFAYYTPDLKGKPIPVISGSIVDEKSSEKEYEETKERAGYREEWLSKVERYRMIWEDIIESHDDPNQPFTDEQQEAFNYYEMTRAANLYLERLEQGNVIGEIGIETIEDVYPDRSYMNKN